MPNPIDFVLVGVLAVAWPLYIYFHQWPRHVRRVELGDPRARVDAFRQTIIEQWVLTAALAALWIFHARPASALLLRVPEGWQLLVGAGLLLAYVVLMAMQVPGIARHPGTRAKLRERLAPLRALFPHRAEEWHWFMPLAVTAGVCEELLYRGYLIWYLGHWLALVPAVLVAGVVFGFGHAYQGPRGIAVTTMVGLFMSAIFLLTGSLVTCMVFHALMDLHAGHVARVAFERQEELMAATTAQEESPAPAGPAGG